jgi:hypothetical protein
MYSVPIQAPAAERARWLAELAEALARAQRILGVFNFEGSRQAEARELYLRIEAARHEVHSLRLSRSLHPRSEQSPERIETSAW